MAKQKTNPADADNEAFACASPHTGPQRSRSRPRRRYRDLVALPGLHAIDRRHRVTVDRETFALDEGRLARLFAWMAISAFGSLLLARLADRVGRRLVILGALVLAPLFTAGAALAPTARSFAAYEIAVSALLGGSVSSAIVLLAEELPVKQRARGQAAAAFASAIGGVLGYLIIPALLAWNYSWRWLLAPSVAGILLVVPIAAMLPAQSKWSNAAPRAARSAVASTIFFIRSIDAARSRC